MDEIVFVTHNKGKVLSAQKNFSNLKIAIYDYELDEPRSDDIKEIVTAKVKQAYNMIKKPCIALDAGFFIDELNGFPKAFVNFVLDSIGLDGILKLMEGKENRSCKFKECLAFYDGQDIHYFYGESPGNLSNEILGLDIKEKWSDLWYVFKPQNYDKTLAQMNNMEREEKNDNSTSAMKNFVEWFNNNM